MGVGSNIEPESHLERAVSALAGAFRVTGVSTVYRTPSVGPAPQPDYLDAVVEIETALDAGSLEAALHDIERALGRARTADPFAPRTIDLDLLAWLEPGGRRSVWPGIEDVRTRAFVAGPLGELCPELVLPDGTTLAEVIARVPPWPMEPLRELTRVLGESVRDGHRQGTSTRP